MKEEVLRNERIRKLNNFIEKGINPYPYTYPVDTTLKELRDKYDDKLEAHEHTEDFYHIAGRIMLHRDMGGLVFMTLQDEDDQLQVTFMKKELEEEFKLLKNFDMGDIIGVYGNIFKTKKGELSILVKEFQILVKSLTDMGDKYHGVQDIELKYRNRSLDMVMNPESKQILKKRFLITQKIREFMIKEGFLEVETPITQTVYGGAAAKPFITHHNEHDMQMFMRVALEQQLKRVMTGGINAVFEIGKNFRNESIDRTHNPEFTMMEAYIAYKDYNYWLEKTEQLIEFLAKEVLGTTEVVFQGQNVSLKAPWRRLTVKDALKEAKGWDVDSMSDEELFKEVEKIGGELYHKKRGEAILILFEEYGEPLGIQPTHFIDYPKESTPFAKKHRDDPELVERFESFVCGMEVANSYSELNDAILSRKLFEEQVQFAEQGADEIWGMVDEDFLDALELGMPPSGGIGIGIDRLVMVLLGQDSIRDIIFFPTMKPKEKETKKVKAPNKEAVAIINKGLGLEAWQEANTLSHLSAMFAARKGKELFHADEVHAKDKSFKLNIQHAIMIKQAGSNEELRELISQAEEQEIEWYPFTREMIETTSDKKVLEWTKEKNFEDLDLLGVLFFSEQKKVQELTKDIKLL